MIHGHPGIDRMVETLRKMYYFPGMRKEIEDYIRRCTVCRRSKNDKHKPYGLLQPLDVPTRPWQAIAVDFIVRLPASQEPTAEEMYDGIMVVVDRFSKIGHFIPYKETFSATDIAYLMTRNVFAYHRLSRDNHVRQRQPLYVQLLASPNVTVGSETADEHRVPPPVRW